MTKHHALDEADITRLEKKHAELSEKVEDLDGRLSLTPGEELELHRLKKEKLWTKDAIYAARH